MGRSVVFELMCNRKHMKQRRCHLQIIHKVTYIEESIFMTTPPGMAGPAIHNGRQLEKMQYSSSRELLNSCRATIFGDNPEIHTMLVEWNW